MLGLAKDLGAQLLAHAVAGNHLARDLGGALEVVARAGGDVPAEELLRRAAAKEHGDLVQHLVARAQEVVLLRHLHGVAQRLAARDDRDLVDGVGVLQHVAHQSVAALVEGDDLALLLAHHAALALRAGHDALHGLLNLVAPDLLLAPARGQKGALVHEVCQVGAREARGDLGNALKVDVGGQRLVGRMDPQDLLAARDVGAVHRDATVKAARAQQGRVQDVRAVGGGDEDDGGVVLKAVHLYQQLVERLLALVVAAAQAGSALASHGVNLVDEDDAGSGLLGLLEEVAHAGGAHAHEHLHKVRAADGEERHARLAGHGLGQQGLARSRRAHQKDAVRDLGTHLAVALGLGEEVADLLELLHGLVDARDVGELDLGALPLGRQGLGLAEGHGLTVLVSNAAHEVDEDQQHDDGGQHREEQRLQHLVGAGVNAVGGAGVLGHELRQGVRAHVDALEALERRGGALVGAVCPVGAREAAVGVLEGHVLHAVVLDGGHEVAGGQGVRAAGGKGVGAHAKDEVAQHGQKQDGRDGVDARVLGALAARDVGKLAVVLV